MRDDGTEPHEEPFERLLSEAIDQEDERALGVFAAARESVSAARARRSRARAAHLLPSEIPGTGASGGAVSRAALREREDERRILLRQEKTRRSLIGAVCLVGVLGVGAVGMGLTALGANGDPSEAVTASSEEVTGGGARGDEAADARDATDPGPAEQTGSDAAMLPVDRVWASEVAREAGIPERALRAYAGAALTLAEEQPDCGLGWNTLAAIGFVETAHGTIHGSAINENGEALPRIRGVPLDGVEFTAIPDTDDGRLDGDATWDRAVGPMQFIPQTWQEYGRDADGDGVADIDQIDDAALSAATLLCSIGGDLRVPENWIAAVDAYNPSVAYNNDVVEAADYYARYGEN